MAVKKNQCSSASGVSILEIILAIIFAGIMFILMVPKLNLSDADTRLVINRTDAVIMDMNNALTLYLQYSGSTSLNFGTTSIEYIFSNYGHYLSRRGDWTSPSIRYYLLPNGARLTIVPDLFTSVNGGATKFPEYTPPPLTSSKWGPAAGGDGFCGDYPWTQCFYVDINGRRPPNKVSQYHGSTPINVDTLPTRWGEIIPMRIDPATGTIHTLFYWQKYDKATASPKLCDYMSVYDIELGEVCT